MSDTRTNGIHIRTLDDAFRRMAALPALVCGSGIAEEYEATLKITRLCNLNCDYCYDRRPIDDRSVPTQPSMRPELGIAIVKQLLELGTKDLTIVFHGGEPLMHFECVKAVSEFARQTSGPSRVRMTIQTNGTLLGAAQADLFSKHGIQVGIGLDGYNDT